MRPIARPRAPPSTTPGSIRIPAGGGRSDAYQGRLAGPAPGVTSATGGGAGAGAAATAATVGATAAAATSAGSRDRPSRHRRIKPGTATNAGHETSRTKAASARTKSTVVSRLTDMTVIGARAASPSGSARIAGVPYPSKGIVRIAWRLIAFPTPRRTYHQRHRTDAAARRAPVANAGKR